MATIFDNAVNFIGSTLKQVVSSDLLKDYKHASKLFVGSNFRLIPKNGFLFHVFFDINPTLANGQVGSKTSREELGLMVKSVDLPKYNIDTKIYNSYNRPNIVQSKIKFDPITVNFHDDSANIVRHFWYDYFRYYYRDSDYQEQVYKQSYKYRFQDQGKFGYSLRMDPDLDTIEPYLRAIRIYSLHQKKFSEYVLINPIIKNFRHGSHANGADNITMQHDMVIEYENILYQAGMITPDRVPGFGQLQYYDTTPSPLRQKGAVKSIFGDGGLLDTASSVFSVLGNPNATARDYIGAAFLAARGINTARSMNLKKAAISELTTYYTQQTSRALTGVIEKYTVPNMAGTQESSSKYTGLESTTSAAVMAGAAVLLNSTPIVNKYTVNPNNQSKYTNSSAPTNYKPSLPAVTGYTPVVRLENSKAILNDQADLKTSATNQVNISTQLRINDLDNQISVLNNTIGSANEELDLANRQVVATNQNLVNLNAKLANVQATVAVDPQAVAIKNTLISQLQLDIKTMTELNQLAQQTVTVKTNYLNSLKTQMNNLRNQRALIQ